jgi:hypothetical protein
MQAVAPARLHYQCRFVGMLRRSPQPPRAAQAFRECLLEAHAAGATDAAASAPAVSRA